MTDMLASHLEQIEALARSAGWILPVLIFVFMAIESSFVPFPSEVVMIPAGFLIARHSFPGSEWAAGALSVAVAAGLAGSMAGAYVNYYLSLWLGRPILYKYARYFFLSPRKLDRAEEIFREHGEIATFVCRLLPAIRQLISIPAGLSRMNIARFSFFTALGAGLWVVVLTLIGYYLGRGSAEMTYLDLIHRGKEIIHENFVWIVVSLAALVVVYVWVHKKIMGHGGGAKGSVGQDNAAVEPAQSE